MNASMLFYAVWMPGVWEILLILLVVLIFFGGRLPQAARNLGRGFTEFKRGLSDAPEEPDRQQLPPSSGPQG